MFNADLLNKTNFDWIDLKSRESEIIQKIHGDTLYRGQEPIEKTI